MEAAAQVWVGEVKVGSSQKPLNLVFDTGADKVLVQSIDCRDCKGRLYNPAFGGQLVDSNNQTFIHGKASVEAITYMDRVCTTEWDCAEDFEFYGAVSQTGIAPPVEGYLGLCQDYPKDGDRSLERGPLYVNALVK